MQLERKLNETRAGLLKYSLIAIFISTPILLIYTKLMRVSVEVLLNLKLSNIIIIIIFMSIAPILNSLRMIYIAENIGVNDKVGGILARIASQLIASITPSTVAAHIIKSYWVKKNGLGWSEGLGVSLTDSFFDALIWSLVVLFVSLRELFKGYLVFLPIFLISILPLIGYPLIFIVGMSSKLRSATVKLINIMRLPLSEGYLESLSNVFLSTIKNPKRLLIVLLFSSISLLFQGFIIVIISLSLGIKITIIDGIIFFTMSEIMKALPVPAGAGFSEFGMSLVANAEIVFIWRILTLTYLISYYFVFFKIFTLKYFESI